jgi:hypothetical protein
MSTKIGGPHRCNIHPEFEETDDVNEWNKHCSETEGHPTNGACPCITCKREIPLNQIPYQPIGQEFRLQCPDCFNKNQDLNILVNQQQGQTQQTQEISEGGAVQ